MRAVYGANELEMEELGTCDFDSVLLLFSFQISLSQVPGSSGFDDDGDLCGGVCHGNVMQIKDRPQGREFREIHQLPSHATEQVDAAESSRPALFHDFAQL